MVVRFVAAVLLIAASVATQAQEAARVYRIGFVTMSSPKFNPALDALRQGLGEQGYIEGKNVIIEVRFAEGRPERVPELIAEVLRLKLDVLVVGSTRGVLAAKKATTTVPIVFASVFDPVASGIDPFFTVNRAQLVQFAASKRLPAVYFYKLFADAGGLMSYGGSLEDSYRRAATQVDKILKGARPADLPVDQPTRFELVINLKAARALGLTIPPSVLLRADHLIK